ncbi:MAG: hypothetical protein GY884_08950 [Proteobacteria bacterium]|nr:hypothetical protein [Pseudomonadota bacterium]
MWLILSLGCPPKTPPEGSVPMEPPMERPMVEMPNVAGNPLPFGTAYPFDAPATDTQQALVRADELLAGMKAWPMSDSAAGMKKRAVDIGLEGERALAELEVVGSDANLAGIGLCRAGDAWRLMAEAMADVPPPVPGAMGYQTELDAATAPIWGHSRAAYLMALEIEGLDDRWNSHALWGLGKIEELRAE